MNAPLGVQRRARSGLLYPFLFFSRTRTHARDHVFFILIYGLFVHEFCFGYFGTNTSLQYICPMSHYVGGGGAFLVLVCVG